MGYYDQIKAVYTNGTEIPESGGRSLYVFDLKGNPVRKYNLDRSISAIYVNEEEGYS